MTALPHHPAIDRESVTRLLGALIEIPSVNPAYDPASPGESRLGDAVGAFCADLGLDISTEDVLDGRRNLLARLRPSGPVRSRVMIEVHLDTVGLPPGQQLPTAVVIGNRMHGRGACDVKGGLAAALLAIERIVDAGGLSGIELILLGAADEEYAFRGITNHLAAAVPPDAAIVLEPTRGRIVNAHHGVLRVDLLVEGQAAHTSRPDQGRNAILDAIETISRIRAWHAARVGAQPPGTSPSTLSVSTIEGGSAINVVPAQCRIGLEVRTSPGEDPNETLESLRTLLAGLTGGVTASIERVHLADGGLDTPAEAELVRAGLAAVAAAGGHVADTPETVPYGTDASKLSRAGTPAIVYGPGSIDQAHRDDEWVELDEVVEAAQVLERLIRTLDAAAPGGDA